MSVEANKAIIRRWIEEGWNQGKADLADELYAADFSALDIDQPNKNLRGPEDIKTYLRQMRTAFPDIHFTIDHLFGEDDKVVGAFTIRGTHRGDFAGIAPTGRKVLFQAIDIWRLQDGKIAERCIARIDRLDLMEQLGTIIITPKKPD
jgi:steroid delta-isomerase-like uncharacterized protein